MMYLFQRQLNSKSCNLRQTDQVQLLKVSLVIHFKEQESEEQVFKRKNQNLYQGSNLFDALSKKEKKTPFQEKISKKFNGEQVKIDLGFKEVTVAKKALLCLQEDNRLRLVCLKIVSHKHFENLILVCILLNSLTLAMFDYSDRNSKTKYNQVLDILGLTFTLIFTLEALLKILALGFIFNKYAYLRDGWNFIDFFVVLTGVFEFLPIDINLRALRTFRIMRPLRSINAMPSMRRLVTTLILSLPDFANVITFLVFLFFMISVIALHQFAGKYTFKCRETQAPVNATYWPLVSPQNPQVCSNKGEGGRFECADNNFCGSILDYSLEDSVDNTFNDPSVQFGIMKFDNFFYSMLSIFQIITMDNWSVHLYLLMDTSFSIIPGLFLPSILVFVGFCMMNLILAVIIQSFTTIEKQEKKEQEAQNVKGEALKKIHQALEVPIEKQNTKFRRQLSARGQKSSQQELKSRVKDFDNLLASPRPPDDNLLSPNPVKKQKSDAVSFNLKSKYLLAPEQESKDDISSFSPNQSIVASDRQVLVKKQSNVSDVSGRKDNQLKMMSLFHEIKQVEQDGEHKTKKRETNKKIKELHRELAMIMNERKDVLMEKDVRKRANSKSIFKLFYKIVSSKAFSLAVTFCIILNTVILSLDRYPMGATQMQILEGFNFFFNGVFLIEMIFKLIGLGFKFYFADKFNTFDCVIVVFSVLDMTLFSFIQDGGGGAFSALRAFRLLRIFKLAKSWKQLHILLKTMAKTLKDIYNFMILLFLLLFVYSLLGMELFGFKAKFKGNYVDMENGDFPNSTFNDFTQAFASVFIVLANDGWSPIFFDHYRSVGSVQALIFFLTLLIIGQFILLNLFLAILLQNFDDESLKPSKQKKMEVFAEAEAPWYKQIYFSLMITYNKVFRKEEKKKERHVRQGLRFLDKVIKQQDLEDRHQINKDKKIMEGKTLNIFTVDSGFRRLCYNIVNHDKFNGILLFAIILSSVVLALESPLIDPKSQLFLIIFYLDVLLTVFFLFEAFIKIVAFGFIKNGKDSYMKSLTNIFDFSLILTTVFGLLGYMAFRNATGMTLQLFKYVRLIRAFRPLRLVSHNKGFARSMKTLILAVPNIVNVTIISFLFFLIFGIIGVNYFKGGFSRCIELPDLNINVKDKWSCKNAGGLWENRDYHFDNISASMITFFHMSTTVGWQLVMYQAISSRGPNLEPDPQYSPLWAYFFIFFMIVGSFFILNLFVGIVINTFNKQKEFLGKTFLLSDNQKEWLHLQNSLQNLKPYKFLDSSKVGLMREFCFKLSNHRYFESFITFSIVSNAILMTLHYARQSENDRLIIKGFSIFFYTVFVIEAIAKIIAMGTQYFKDNWNLFDFIIVVGATLSMIIGAIPQAPVPLKSLLNTFINTRTFKLVKRSDSLYFMFNTLIATIPALLSVGGLLFILLYFYAILGVFVFAEVKVEGNYPLTHNLNFQNFFNAILALIRIASGEAWHDLLTAVSKQDGGLLYTCDPDFRYEAYKDNNYETLHCGHPQAFIYFFTYLILVKLVFLNLFIAIILEGFEDTVNSEKKLFHKEKINYFLSIWQQYDPYGTGKIAIKDFKEFLFELGAPMGFDEDYRGQLEFQDQFISQLKLPTYDNFKNFYYIDVIQALCKKLITLKNMWEREIEANLEEYTFDLEEAKYQVEEELAKEFEEMDNNDDNIISLTIYQRIREQREKKRKQLNVDVGVSSGSFLVLRAVIKMLTKVKQRRRERLAQQSIIEQPLVKQSIEIPQKTTSSLKQSKSSLVAPSQNKEEVDKLRTKTQAVEEEIKAIEINRSDLSIEKEIDNYLKQDNIDIFGSQNSGINLNPLNGKKRPKVVRFKNSEISTNLKTADEQQSSADQLSAAKLQRETSPAFSRKPEQVEESVNKEPSQSQSRRRRKKKKKKKFMIEDYKKQNEEQQQQADALAKKEVNF